MEVYPVCIFLLFLTKAARDHIVTILAQGLEIEAPLEWSPLSTVGLHDVQLPTIHSARRHSPSLPRWATIDSIPALPLLRSQAGLVSAEEATVPGRPCQENLPCYGRWPAR